MFALLRLFEFINWTVFLFYRKRSTESRQDTNVSGTDINQKVPSTNQHTNQAFVPSSVSAADGDDKAYHDITDQSQEYAYAYADQPRPASAAHNNDNAYAYADSRDLRVSAPEMSDPHEGWKKNSIYGTDDGIGATSNVKGNAEEGWMENNIYVTSDDSEAGSDKNA